MEYGDRRLPKIINAKLKHDLWNYQVLLSLPQLWSYTHNFLKFIEKYWLSRYALWLDVDLVWLGTEIFNVRLQAFMWKTFLLVYADFWNQIIISKYLQIKICICLLLKCTFDICIFLMLLLHCLGNSKNLLEKIVIIICSFRIFWLHFPFLIERRKEKLVNY